MPAQIDSVSVLFCVGYKGFTVLMMGYDLALPTVVFPASVISEMMLEVFAVLPAVPALLANAADDKLVAPLLIGI